MIGAGVFSLPQNMAAVASPLAVTIGWIITGVGMVFLALAFQALSHARPDINTGVFGYAKAGFGDLVGFFSAWGYWLSAALANVSYLVIVFSTLGMFFDTPNHVIFGEGNTVISVAAATVMVWAIHLLVHRGVQTAAVINMVTTVAKMIPLLILIGGLIYAFSTQTFFWDFSGLKTFPGKSLIEQVKGTMLVTVWVFIGIEGAVVVSSRAKNRKDVGRATIIGLLTALSIYVLVTLLSMGVIKTPALAAMQNPSAAVVLEHIFGRPGLIIVGLGLIISVGGAFLSWTLLASEAPYISAKEGMFPARYGEQSQSGCPTRSLMLTNLVVQVSLIAVIFVGGTYDSLLAIASEMILVPYLLVGAYALKLGLEEKARGTALIGFLATVYGLWLLYASGLEHLLMSSLLYLLGLGFYIRAKHENNKAWFVGSNRWVVIGLLILAGIALQHLVFV